MTTTLHCGRLRPTIVNLRMRCRTQLAKRTSCVLSRENINWLFYKRGNRDMSNPDFVKVDTADSIGNFIKPFDE